MTVTNSMNNIMLLSIRKGDLVNEQIKVVDLFEIELFGL